MLSFMDKKIEAQILIAEGIFLMSHGNYMGRAGIQIPEIWILSVCSECVILSCLSKNTALRVIGRCKEKSQVSSSVNVSSPLQLFKCLLGALCFPGVNS